MIFESSNRVHNFSNQAGEIQIAKSRHQNMSAVVPLLGIFLLCLLVLDTAVARPRLPDSMRLSFQLNGTCPCQDASLCAPVTATHAKEIWGFSGDDWHSYPWDLVTGVAWDVSDPQLLCTAHKSKARLIVAAPTPIPLSSDAAVRAAYIKSALQLVTDNFLDGITFDYEEAIKWNAPEVKYYTQLVAETTAAFHALLPGSQISVCVAWSPDDIDGRAYDHAGLADAADFLYVMAYDTRSQIFGQCIAGANCPLATAERGLQRYLDLGIAPSKLILGVPWYGYVYPCLPGTQSTATFCPTVEVPFRGVNCSDASGHEVEFFNLMALLDARQNSTPLMWDDSTQTPYFNFIDSTTGLTNQVWFDNAESLRLKYQAAKRLGVHGTGPFTFSDLDSDGSKTGNPHAPAEARAMWQALRSFL